MAPLNAILVVLGVVYLAQSARRVFRRGGFNMPTGVSSAELERIGKVVQLERARALAVVATMVLLVPIFFLRRGQPLLITALVPMLPLGGLAVVLALSLRIGLLGGLPREDP